MLLHNIGFWLKLSLLLTASSVNKERNQTSISWYIYILVPCTCAENWRNDTFTHKDFMSESVVNMNYGDDSQHSSP